MLIKVPTVWLSPSRTLLPPNVCGENFTLTLSCKGLPQRGGRGSKQEGAGGGTVCGCNWRQKLNDHLEHRTQRCVALGDYAILVYCGMGGRCDCVCVCVRGGVSLHMCACLCVIALCALTATGCLKRLL